MHPPSPRRSPLATTGFRIGAAFAVLLALFAAALVVVLGTLDRLAQADAQLDRLDRAKHAGHRAVMQMREQSIQQLRTIVGEEPASAAAYDEVARVTERMTAGLADHARTDEERALARDVAALARTSDERFRTEMLPALERGDRDAAVTAHARSAGEIARAVEQNEHLNRLFEGAAASAHARAAVLRRQARLATLLFFALAIAIAAAIGIGISRWVGRRMAALRAGARRVGAGDLGSRIALAGSDEFSELAAVFDQMTEDLGRREHQLMRAQKLASIGQVAAGVAHEINNPLGVILGYARLMDESEEARIIADEALQCQRIVEGLLDLARPPKLALADVDIADLARDTLDRLGDAGKLDGLRVERPAEDAVVIVRADEGKLRQVLWNVVLNAAEATPAGGTVTVAARLENGDAVLSVADTGPGIPAEVRARVLEPFFTTKPRGTGLGLAIAHALAEAHGGHIDIDSTVGRGTEVALRLPKAQEGASP